MSSCHVLIMCKLPCIINNDHIFLSFGMYLPGQSSCHLYMAFQTVTKHGKWSYKSQKKGLAMYFTWPLPVTLLRVYQVHYLPASQSKIIPMRPLITNITVVTDGRTLPSALSPCFPKGTRSIIILGVVNNYSAQSCLVSLATTNKAMCLY